MGPVIEARGLTHEYPDGTRALSDLDLTVETGEQIAVIGANGSGKSTLQLVLGGLIEPTAGSVEYFGETSDAEAVRERLGVLLQDPDDYLFNTTVREDIQYGPAQLGLSQAVAERRTEELASTLGLAELLDRPPFRLSGGEKQRAAVASVLSFAPEVLLVDEPLGAVDAHYRVKILDLLANHAGTTLVFTPTLEYVPEIANRVICISREGTIVADGDVRDVLTDQSLLERHGLRPPPTVQLFDGIVDREQLPLTVSEARQYLTEK
ncbi:cobalt/nickel transport system ATP-binding protein [Halohasta litchfieldiae]|jgi:cobalt/nickel transport system ATP-binding protein|uniref:Cobalt/nickel transport system ATP-binding protein n=1 Tax=Halohasta litchfieldiae TaxID=1073996 RepID=A0A1H6UIQ1_9EURY|nr:ABC transporter ATP-binding protein [Halohasta litchfieldiae]ATW87436.1 cobalt/nickel transport system ATP-binding protein [Halohasta litchfieldiae]SEI89657.1 cobalt/nickel transport system ATP-binding protein [Halohasta litchfieldiae]